MTHSFTCHGPLPAIFIGSFHPMSSISFGAKGTRYTPVKKRAMRDLKSTRKGAVKLAKIKGSTRTSSKLTAAWEKRYAKAAPKRKNPSRKGKLTGAAKAEFLRRMAAGKRRAGR